MSEIRTVLSGKKPPHTVQVWDLEFHPWHKFTAKPYRVGVEFTKLTESEKEKAIRVNTEVMVEVAAALHFSAITVPNGFWEVSPGMPAYFWLPPEYRFRQIRLLRDALPKDILLFAVAGGIMGIPHSNEYIEFSYKLFDAPEEIDKKAAELIIKGRELVSKCREAGVDGVISAADLADNRGPFYSPEQMARFILPNLKEWVRFAKSLGCFAIMHSDGNMVPLLESIVECGLQALQAIDPVAGMDMADTQKRIRNRMALCGNVDCGLLVAGKPEQVYQASKKLLLECKGSGNLVFGASNAVQNEVPKENYEAMISAWKEFGLFHPPVSGK